MKWNNGKKRREFETQQAKLKEQYIAAGMTEEQIRAMYESDLAEFNGQRREAEHTFKLDEIDLDNVTVEPDCNSISRYAWIDEISDERIIAALKSMPQEYIEILTEYVIDGFTHEEIAATRGVTRTSITNKISRIKKYLKNFLHRRDIFAVSVDSLVKSNKLGIKEINT